VGVCAGVRVGVHVVCGVRSVCVCPSGGCVMGSRMCFVFVLVGCAIVCVCVCVCSLAVFPRSSVFV